MGYQTIPLYYRIRRASLCAREKSLAEYRKSRFSERPRPRPRRSIMVFKPKNQKAVSKIKYIRSVHRKKNWFTVIKRRRLLSARAITFGNVRTYTLREKYGHLLHRTIAPKFAQVGRQTGFQGSRPPKRKYIFSKPKEPITSTQKKKSILKPLLGAGVAYKLALA